MPTPSPLKPKTEAAARRRRAYNRGRLAERLAAWWLRLKGYRLLGRNLDLNVGEIDLIMCRGDILAVIEVKHRATFASGMAAISNHQRQRIERATLSFLSRRPELTNLAVRFDVVVLSPWPRHVIDAWRP